MSVTLVRPDSIASEVGALSPTFVCSCRDGGRDAAWVHVAGELDLVTTPQLERTLGNPGSRGRLVVLDLRELSFIDSSGVHAIVNASSRVRRAGRRLVLLRGPPCVDRLFTLTGSSDKLEIYDLDPGEPSVQVLLQLAAQEHAR
jgi:anti-sigma B factor antagonist